MPSPPGPAGAAGLKVRPGDAERGAGLPRPGLAEEASVEVYELIRMVVPLHQRQL